MPAVLSVCTKTAPVCPLSPALADVDANAGAKSVAVKGTVKNLTAEALAKAYKKGDVITGGPLDLALDVRGAGASPHAIAASLSGSFVAGMGESKIANKAMNLGPILQIVSAANPLAKQEPYTVATCAVANFQIDVAENLGALPVALEGNAYLIDAEFRLQGGGRRNRWHERH